ncbi:hypothetical protein [Desulfofustis glycolicus]
MVVFGSTSRGYFDHQEPAGKDAITKVRRRLRNLEADLGGTEMYDALQTTVDLTGPAILQGILLITDGEIWEEEEIFELMGVSNHRVFAVGVGSAVLEGFLRRLADMTGGACELVVPNEEMSEKSSAISSGSFCLVPRFPCAGHNHLTKPSPASSAPLSPATRFMRSPDSASNRQAPLFVISKQRMAIRSRKRSNCARHLRNNVSI